MTEGRKIWKTGVALRQDWDACVAFAWVGLLMAAPKGDHAATARQGYDLAFRINIAALNIANEGYAAAELGAVWAERQGLIDGHASATDLDDLRRVVTEVGPVVFSCDWFFPSMGGTRRDGSIGVNVRQNPMGHCAFVYGYDPVRRVAGVRQPAFKVRSSWGRSWGRKGSCWITATDLDRLILLEGGYGISTCYPIGRRPTKVADLLA